MTPDFINRPLTKTQKDKLFADRFGYVRAYFEELEAEERQVTEQDKAIYCLCRPERLIELAWRYILFDAGEKKIARYQQYFAVKSIVRRVREIGMEGRQYRLKVIESLDKSVKLKGRFIHVQSPCKKDPSQIRKLVEKWFLERARAAVKRSSAFCLPRVIQDLAQEPRLFLRRMRKRWGSCTKRGNIYLNPELVKAPSSCIDYVITHELCHLAHPDHSPKFYALLRRAMPDWELRKARLERLAATE